MGIAILCVMLFHVELLSRVVDLSSPPGWNWLAYETFWWCVDLFLFLSGLGCSYALQRHGTRQFYNRRLLRILPVVFLAGIIKCLFFENHFNWSDINDLRRLCCFDQWYIVTYLILVAAYPLIDKCLRRGLPGGFLLFIGVSLLPLAAMTLLPGPIYRLGIISWTLTRAPSFIVGAWLGNLYARRKDILAQYPLCLHAIWVVLMIAAYFWLQHVFGTTGFSTDTPVNLMIFVSLLLPSLCYLAASLLYRIDGEEGRTKHVLSTLALFGSLSLELYLVHEYIYGKIIRIPVDWNLFQFIPITFPLSLLAALALQKATALAIRMFTPHQSASSRAKTAD